MNWTCLEEEEERVTPKTFDTETISGGTISPSRQALSATPKCMEMFHGESPRSKGIG